MVHLPSFIDYIKIKWVKRIHDNPGDLWQKLVALIIGIKTDAESVWWLSRNKLVELKRHVKKSFWKDVIESVIKVKKEQLSVPEYIQKDIRNFCSFSDYSYYTKWRENGLLCLNDLCLNDLLKNDGNFKTFDEVKDQLNCKNFLKYYQVIDRVPTCWKTKIKIFKENNEILDVCDDDLLLMKIITDKSIKFVYEMMRDKETICEYTLVYIEIAIKKGEKKE